MKSKFWHLMVFLALIVSMLPMTVAAAPAEPEATPQTAVPEKAPVSQAPTTGVAPTAQAGNGVESLSGSTVTFAPSVGGDVCYIPGATQTFCFNAHSLTADWEYVYNVWVKFPTDWTVTNAYVQGTPACTGGGSWGDFSWSFQTSPYEVNISHPRYQATIDDCTAYYCFEVTAGTPQPFAAESWYWDGDGYNYVPHNPCSSDQYTPAGQNACDEYVNPVAQVPVCAMDPGVYLLPESQEAEGCNGVAQEHTVSVYNNTGTDGTFAMSYSVPSTNGTLTGPATVFAAQGAVAPFVVTLTPDLCAQTGALVVGQVDTAGNGYTDSAAINKTVTTGGNWETVASSAPSWAGNGYVSDGCTAVNGSGQTVTYLIGDMSGTGPVGFWGYNHTTNAWFQPGPTGTPADRWAPDWAYDPATNLCYLTGGANTPGGGTYNEAYVYDPVTNAFTALPSFTSIRDFHDSWIGVVDGVKYLCIGGGNNGAGLTSTQCYGITAGTWAAENATIGVYPTDIWGAADGVLHAAGGDQLWTVAGAQTGSLIADLAFYFDDADNAWHAAGNTGVARYRVEGDFFNGAFYQVAGSDGTFTGTTDVRRGVNVGGTWTWEEYPDVPNRRMDNIANVADGTLWSIEGYGSTATNYVDYWAGCPACDLQGWLEGTVLDGDTQPVAAAGQGIESLSGSNVTFYPQAGGDPCHPGYDFGTYCFRAESYTNDYEYRYGLWLRFPTGWNVQNAYVVGTPVCDSGTNWGTFSWFYEGTNYNEIQIDHAAYQQTTDHCVATYCVDFSQNKSAPEEAALVSWYWDGDGYNAAPHHPCSSDGYTPISMSDEPCDEWVNPQASVPECAEPGPTCTAATVTINPGDITVGVDPATGHYGPVQLIQGEYTVEATAPGYSTETATVTIIDEMTTTQDFILWRPVVDVDPTDPISVYAEPSQTVTIPLTISNLGHMPLDWEVLDFGTGAIAAQKGAARTTVASPDKIEAYLTSALDKGPADFFVWLTEKADLSPAAALRTKAEKGEFVFNALKTTSERTQQALRGYLDQKGVSYKPFYIANKILVRGGNKALALELAGRRDVARLTANHQFQLQEPFVYPLPDHTEAVEGNISFIFAPEVWALGYTGQGTVMAGNDTGLDETHPTIAAHYRGCLNPPTCTSWDHNYNWWDATGTYPNDPYDGHGHGTHTAGTMVGDDGAGNQIGVAPGAQTVHCKNMDDSGGGSDGTFTECFQWDLAPWDLSGANPDPAMAPDAINNSWGYWGGNDPQFEDEIAALQAAGILVEVSAGNEGPSCSTLRSPGDYEQVLTTGSVDDEGQTFPGIITMEGWSPSRGPSALYPGDYFPDIMAPGQNVRSSLPGNSYGSWGGTSMAGPHATALVGLIWSAAPSLRGQVEETIEIIRESAGPLTGQGGSNCGGDYTTGPNNDWGFGTINALAAVNLALQSADLAWVWEEPITGTIPPLESQVMDVMFHCTPEQEGLILTGTLRINHNDPCAESIDIPIEMICGEPTDPDIEVAPPALSTIQLPDEQIVQTLNINNLGTLPLDWTIVEHNPSLALTLAAPSAPQTSRPVELKLDAVSGTGVQSNPPVVDAPVSLVLDDGSAENFIGLNDGTAGYQFLWLNRFTPNAADFPFNLTQIQVLFGFTNVPFGGIVDLVVYQDTDGDGDPGNATWLATYNVTIQAVDGETWSVYDLAAPLALSGPGDVLIGVINRYEVSGQSPADFPAGLDQGASQQRSWVAGWSADPPVPPVLPPDAGGLWGLVDTFDFPGNWTVRGYGETIDIEPPPECEPVDIPWATVDPTTGTTGGYGTFSVDVTFDSTGYASGTYTGTLCVESNDPDEPFVLVPLTMTVLALQNIVVTPPSLTEELCPDATATQQITICNTGDVPLTWEMTEVSSTMRLAGRTASPKVSRPVELKLEAAGGASVETNPPVVDAPITLILDDGSRDNDIGLGGTIEMLWVNRFTPAAGDFPFALNQIQIYFSTVGLVNVGDDIVLIVYENTTGNADPAVGSNFLAAIPTTILALDSWNVYDLATPVVLNGPGDVLIGAIGMETPGTSYWPASIDQTATQSRSWAGWWNSSPPPTPPVLPPDNWTLIDAYFPGNWMVRGYGETVTLFDIPWLSEDPLEGTVPAGQCVVVDVTFDSTGLAAGIYNGGLLIESNDPDTPEVTVPVQLTVLEPATISGVTYTVNGLEVTFDATATGPDLTFAWGFGDGYTSALEDPVHAYAEAGCYMVTLTVSNGCGSATWTEEICVSSPFLYYYVPLVFNGTGTPWPPPDHR